MARIRTIKPEFFTDEDVGRLPPLERVLYVGLWTEADRRGRLLDKPVTLKVKLLPYDDCDIGAMLQHLHEAGFIQRYQVDGTGYICIPRFEAHQRPHPKEVDCNYPEPPASKPPSREITRQEIKDPHLIPSSPVGREGKGKEGKGTTQPPLRERLDAVFLELRKAPYRWQTVDENALRGLMGEDPEDIVRRWRVALQTSFPKCRGIPDLAQNWNSYTGMSQERPQVQPPTQWRTIADDEDPYADQMQPPMAGVAA